LTDYNSRTKRERTPDFGRTVRWMYTIDGGSHSLLYCTPSTLAHLVIHGV